MGLHGIHKMVTVKFLITFILLLVFYFPKDFFLFNGVIETIELFGNSGAHVLIFYLLFYISKIYSFHIERIAFNSKMNFHQMIVDNASTLIICIIFPVFVVRATGFYSLTLSDFSFIDFTILFVVSCLLFDSNRSIRFSIVSKYEELIEKWGHRKGVFFTGYPPNNIEDIIYGVVIMAVFSLVILLIGSIR